MVATSKFAVCIRGLKAWDTLKLVRPWSVLSLQGDRLHHPPSAFPSLTYRTWFSQLVIARVFMRDAPNGYYRVVLGQTVSSAAAASSVRRWVSHRCCIGVMQTNKDAYRDTLRSSQEVTEGVTPSILKGQGGAAKIEVSSLTFQSFEWGTGCRQRRLFSHFEALRR